MPAPALHFWDWKQAVLDHVVAELTHGWAGGELNLADKILLVPTAEAGRRLREALAVAAAEREGAVVAPWVWHPEIALSWTQGVRTTASPVQEQMSWRAVLGVVAAGEFPALFPVMPEKPESAWVSGTAEMLSTLARALGAGGHTMASVAKVLEGADDHARWVELAALEHRYLAMLAKLGVTDAQEVKRTHAGQPRLPEGVREVLVLAVPDPPPLLREWITQVSGKVVVKVFIHAPDKMRQAFDPLGVPSPEAWGEAAGLILPVADETLHILTGPQEQAACAVAHLAEMARGGLTIAVGACDPALNSHLAGALSAEDAAAFDPAGRAAEQHALTQVLRAWHRMVQSHMWTDVAALLRMEDVVQAVCPSAGISEIRLLSLVDELHEQHLPPTLEVAISLARDDDFEPLRAALERMRGLVDLWTGASSTSALRALLDWLYGAREFATEHEQDRDYVKLTGEAMALAAALDETHESLGGGTSAGDLLSLLLGQLDLSRLADTRGEVDFVLHGWLELPWEPASGLVITGFNEEHVPGIVTGDAFLPDSLKRKLGLACQASRRARDAFLLRAMVEQRREKGALHLVLGRTNDQGDAQRPSRLLFDCADAALVSRVRRLFPKDDEATREAAPAASIGFRLRPPGGSTALKSISPSALRSYLACPFHFYLKNVLGVSEVDATTREASPMDFGNLIHEALCEYATDPAMKDCVDGPATARWLDDAVVRLWRRHYGPQPLLSLELQLESARQRLVAAAEKLATLRGEGWRTIHAEERVKEWGLSIGGVPFTGKLDRVDRHVTTDALRIWDYKTGAKAAKPRETHLDRVTDDILKDAALSWQCLTDADGKTKRWVDLQLPLYVWALRQKHPQAEITAGYFVLPATVTDSGPLMWEDLDEETIKSAEECATKIVERIQAGVFWPPAAEPPQDAWEPLLGDALQTVDPAALLVERSPA